MAARIAAEGVVEAAEIRQGRQVLGERPHAPLLDAPLGRAGVLDAFVQFLGDLDQHLDQIGGRAAGGADVGHEQDRVARGLVDLDAVLVHQDVGLEGVAVEPGLSDRKRQAGRVEGELVVGPSLPDVGPAVILVVVGLDAGLAILLGHQIADRQHLEVLAEQGVGGDPLAQHHRHLDLLLDQLEALQLDLPAADVERGQDLIVGRGRGVGHVGLVERLLDFGFVVLIVDVDHRALAQGGERLVGRLGGVDPHARPGRIGHEAARQPGLVVVRVERLDLLPVGRVTLAVGRAAIALAQGFGAVHGGALAVGRREAGEAEPGLVPQEHQVGLEGEALLHHSLDVVDDAVEGAVGEQQHLHALELAGAPEGQQLPLDLLERHRAVHGEFRQRIGIEIDHLCAAQHQAVMVRLVAIAVDQHDVARPHQGLDDDLVAGRGAVGGEEGLARAERAGRQFLRLLDGAVGIEQGVEPAGGRRGLGEEDVHAVEVAHVADPVRLADRLAAGDRHGVEHAGGLLAVSLEGGEEGRLVAPVDAAQDVEVKLHVVFLIVEHPAAGLADPARHLLHRLIGDQVDVELGPERANQLG